MLVGDLAWTRGRIIRLYACWTCYGSYAILSSECLVIFCSLPDAASDAISGVFVRPIGFISAVKLGCVELHLSWDIRLEVVGRAFWRVYRFNFQSEAADVVISDSTMEDIGIDVCVHFCCSWSYRCRYIRPAHFVPTTNDDGLWDGNRRYAYA